MSRLGLVWRTVRHLKARQILFRGLNRLRARPRLRLPQTAPAAYPLPVPPADKPVSVVGDTFTFLNQSVTLGRPVNWNYAGRGKLWTYHLNYFDFLNQPGLPVEMGRALLRDFGAQTDRLRDGLEPYPTSLRIGNWVQFLSRHRLSDARINAGLYAQAASLSRRFEHHLLGNHLLENGFALLTAALFFRQTRWLHQAARIVGAELTTQVLADGGHDERSPVYHQILLDRLLDVLPAFGQARNGWPAGWPAEWPGEAALVALLTENARRMLGWLNNITFANGDVPMVNDAAPGVAPTTAHLRAKAAAGGWTAVSRPLAHAPTTGYRMLRQPRYELFVDAGAVGPDHQPGHAHADTFSFVLYAAGRPLLVDTGTSTYEPGPRRAWERSTAAHNTVEVGGQNSSEVWAGFRVGRRARVTRLADTATTLSARHDGYAFLGVTHARTWQTAETRIVITDQLTGPGVRAGQAVARFYFHPDVVPTLHETGVWAGPLRLTFAPDDDPAVRLETVQLADGFNRLRNSLCLTVRFTARLETTLTLYV